MQSLTLLLVFVWPCVFFLWLERRKKLKADQEPKSKRGQLLKEGVSPMLQWNKYLVSHPRVGFWGREIGPAKEANHSEQGADAIPPDHDYVSSWDPAVVDMTLSESTSLIVEIQQLRTRAEELGVKQRFGIHRFAASDKDIRFFTRYDVPAPLYYIIDRCMRHW